MIYHKQTKRSSASLGRFYLFCTDGNSGDTDNYTLFGESVRTSWRVEISGGLLGKPSSSDTAPASSSFFPVITRGGDPSLTFCCSWSCCWNTEYKLSMVQSKGDVLHMVAQIFLSDMQNLSVNRKTWSNRPFIEKSHWWILSNYIHQGHIIKTGVGIKLKSKSVLFSHLPKEDRNFTIPENLLQFNSI